MNTKHKFLAVVSSVALIGGVLAPAASAATASRPGSYSWSSGTSATNRDTAADGKFTSVKWGHSNNATGTFVNKNGYNQTAGGTTGATVVKVQACISRPAPLPMACTDWNQWL